MKQVSEFVEKEWQKYRIDGEFYISDDESHIIYRGIKFI